MYVLLMYGIVSILAVISLLMTDKKYKKVELVLFVILMVFFALRFPLGTDIDTYNEIYSNTTNSLISAIKGIPYPDNIGYNVFMTIAKILNLDFNGYMLYFNVIIGLIIGIVCYKKSDNLLISLVILVGSGIIQVYYSGMLRQMIVMALFLYAYYRYLENNNYFMYYAIVFIAISFQWIALVLLFIPLVKIFFDNTNGKVRIILPLIATVLLFFVMVYIVPKYAYLVPGRFGQYLHADVFSPIGLVSRIIVLFGVIIPFIFADRDELSSFDVFSVYLCYISLLIYIVLSQNAIFSRVSDMISIIEIILVPKLISNISNKNKSIISALLTISINFIFLFSDIHYIANQSLKNISLKEYPLIYVWEDINYQELFKED